jgi:4-amino-4-deoxy-L-arabinose transferase-like glycosyltransferase
MALPPCALNCDAPRRPVDVALSENPREFKVLPSELVAFSKNKAYLLIAMIDANTASPARPTAGTSVERARKKTSPLTQAPFPYDSVSDGNTFRRACTTPALILLVTLCLVSGIWGHSPWKADEPYSFGIAWKMASEGNWVVPYVGVNPFVEKPPLVYWLGALLIRAGGLIGWPISPVGMVGFVTTGLSSITIVALASIANRLDRAAPAPPCHPHAPHALRTPVITAGLLAALIFSGTLGLIEHTHKFIADNGQLAGAALGLLGLVRMADGAGRSGHVGAGLLLGAGFGVSFLSKGLLVPGTLVLTLLLGLASPPLRNRRSLLACAWASMIAIPALVIWPFLLWRASPALFSEWLWTHNVGRFIGGTHLGGHEEPLSERALAFAFAALPPGWIVIAGVARYCRKRLHPGPLATPAGGLFTPRPAPLARTMVRAYVSVSMMALVASACSRSVYFVPAVFGLIALAATSPRIDITPPGPVSRLGRLSTRTCTWLARGLTALAAGLALCLFALFITLCANGGAALPDTLADIIRRTLPLPFTLTCGIWMPGAACLAMLAWAGVQHVSHGRPAIAFASGIAMLWAIAGFLFTPWLEAARGYQAVFSAVAPAVRDARQCVASSGMGESEHAIFSYATGVDAIPVYLGHSGNGDAHRPNPKARQCDQWLMSDDPQHPAPAPDPALWRKRWEGQRAAEHRERFILYEQREDTTARPPS